MHGSVTQVTFKCQGAVFFAIRPHVLWGNIVAFARLLVMEPAFLVVISQQEHIILQRAAPSVQTIVLGPVVKAFFRQPAHA